MHVIARMIMLTCGWAGDVGSRRGYRTSSNARQIKSVVHKYDGHVPRLCLVKSKSL